MEAGCELERRSLTNREFQGIVRERPGFVRNCRAPSWAGRARLRDRSTPRVTVLGVGMCKEGEP